MDLSETERLNGKLWQVAKQGAFMCFVVACALLGASLVLTDWGGERGSGPGPRMATTGPGQAR
jgi:hypothetical protein